MPSAGRADRRGRRSPGRRLRPWSIRSGPLRLRGRKVGAGSSRPVARAAQPAEHWCRVRLFGSLRPAVTPRGGVPSRLSRDLGLDAPGSSPLARDRLAADTAADGLGPGRLGCGHASAGPARAARARRRLRVSRPAGRVQTRRGRDASGRVVRPARRAPTVGAAGRRSTPARHRLPGRDTKQARAGGAPRRRGPPRRGRRRPAHARTPARKARPAGARAAPAPPQRRPDGRGRHVVPELEQLAADPPVAPASVLSGQSLDQRAQIRGKRRSTRTASPAVGAPFALE
jgi:hypothetical protein